MKTQNQSPVGQERHLFLMVKSIDPSNPNIVHATVSTDEIDRYDEIVQPSAIVAALPSFLANPVVLPAHQHRLENGEPPVIGRVIPDSIRVSEHQIDVDIEFDDDELGQKYARKYQKKMMRAFSIGFRGLEGKFEQITEAVKSIVKKIWIWTLIELLEISAVAVPANRGALARANGYFESEDNKEVIAAAVKEQFADFKQFIEESLDDIKSIIIAERGELGDGLLGDPLNLPASGGDEAKTAERILNICKEISSQG